VESLGNVIDRVVFSALFQAGGEALFGCPLAADLGDGGALGGCGLDCSDATALFGQFQGQFASLGGDGLLVSTVVFGR